jgi:hypothetical protein
VKADWSRFEGGGDKTLSKCSQKKEIQLGKKGINNFRGGFNVEREILARVC